MLNESAIDDLIEICKNDRTLLEFVEDCMKSFELYHRAVYELEIYKKLHGGVQSDGSDYRDRVTELDRSRTLHHNTIIANVRILNRLSLQNNLPPIYDGTVSEERPHRRILADSVFEYAENIIKNRG